MPGELGRGSAARPVVGEQMMVFSSEPNDPTMTNGMYFENASLMALRYLLALTKPAICSKRSSMLMGVPFPPVCARSSSAWLERPFSNSSDPGPPFLSPSMMHVLFMCLLW